MSDFKPTFRTALRQVISRYQSARVEVDGHGLRLFQQPAAGNEAACPAVL